MPPIHPVLRCRHADLPKRHVPPFLGSLPWLPIAYKMKSKLLSIESSSCSLAPQPCASWAPSHQELLPRSHKYPPHVTFMPLLVLLSLPTSVLFILFANSAPPAKPRKSSFLPHCLTQPLGPSMPLAVPPLADPLPCPWPGSPLSPPPRYVLVEGRHFV